MIKLKYSTNNRSSYQVFKNEIHIGNIQVKRDMLSEKYYATIFYDGKKETQGKRFASPHDAVSYIISR